MGAIDPLAALTPESCTLGAGRARKKNPMPGEISCPSCKSRLRLGKDPNVQKVKCAKCGHIIDIIRAAVAGPPPAQVPISRSWLYFAIPVLSILVGLGALSVSIFLRQDILAIAASGFAVILSFVGFICFFAKKAGGFFASLSGLAISVASLAIVIGIPTIRADIEKNQELLSKNEKSEKQAKLNLEEAKQKLDLADDAFRKAEEAVRVNDFETVLH
jgi:hypothetical protein